VPINLSPGLVMSLTLEGALEPPTPMLYMNRFHFCNADFSVPTLEDMDNLIDAWIADGQTAYLAALSTNYILNRIIVETVTDPDRRKIQRFVYADGTRALPEGGQYLPPFLCKVIGWHTSLVSRRFNGKSYHGTAYESDQNNGLWISGGGTTFYDLVYAFAEAMFAAFSDTGTSDYRQVILSDPDHVLPATSAPGLRSPAAATVNGFDADSALVHTQKRRQIGRGA